MSTIPWTGDDHVDIAIQDAITYQFFAMGHLPKGHVSIVPHDLDGREHVPTIRRSSDGQELVAEFDAKVIMEWSAYEELSKDGFKVRWFTTEPWDKRVAEHRENRDQYNAEQERQRKRIQRAMELLEAAEAAEAQSG
jgi:hypothetical protein